MLASSVPYCAILPLEFFLNYGNKRRVKWPPLRIIHTHPKRGTTLFSNVVNLLCRTSFSSAVSSHIVPHALLLFAPLISDHVSFVADRPYFMQNFSTRCKETLSRPFGASRSIFFGGTFFTSSLVIRKSVSRERTCGCAKSD